MFFSHQDVKHNDRISTIGDLLSKWKYGKALLVFHSSTFHCLFIQKCEVWTWAVFHYTRSHIIKHHWRIFSKVTFRYIFLNAVEILLKLREFLYACTLFQATSNSEGNKESTIPFTGHHFTENFDLLLVFVGKYVSSCHILILAFISGLLGHERSRSISRACSHHWLDKRNKRPVDQMLIPERDLITLRYILSDRFTYCVPFLTTPW